LKKKQLVVGLVALALLAAIVIWGHDRMHFDFAAFRSQLALANWGKIGIGLACIYLGYVFRAVRWAWLLRHNKKVPLFSLVGTQVIGFTAVALIGRVADLVRPYLVAKKTSLPLTNQVAVWVVERLFDGGSMALIFSLAIVLAPAGSMPHPEMVKHAGRFGLLVTLLGATFLVVVRLAGGWVASFLERAFGLISKNLGHSVGHKIRVFQTGLDTMRSFGDFAVTASLSVGMWLLIALAYLETMQAFVASPQLAAITPAQCVLMMAVSGVSSVFQLPVLMWFTQTAVVAAAISNFFGASPEASTACGATILLVTFMGIIPVGLIWAQFEKISFRKITAESEQAEVGIEDKLGEDAV
jgi:hypothetical protein